MRDKRSVFQDKLSEALKLPNNISVFAKRCGSPVIAVPLEDKIFIGVCTCSFALCSYTKTTFYIETKERAGIIFPDYHFMLNRNSRNFRPI